MTCKDEQNAEPDGMANGNSANVKEDAKQEVATWLKRIGNKVCWKSLLIGLALGFIVTFVGQELRISKKCPSEWITYRNKCYFISKEEKDWTSSQTFCAEKKSLLAVFENQEEMHSLGEHLKIDESWIGLRKRGESFYWENNVPLRTDLFQIWSRSECAYWGTSSVFTSACSLPRRCICMQRL